MQDDIDEVETEVFSARAARARRAVSDAGRIYQLKREVLEFKRAVSPLLRPMQLLSERPMRLIDPDIQKYFRDVADHLARVQEQVIGFDELLNSILQANLAQASVAQNEDMRKITSWAAIIAVPTMVVRCLRHELRPHAGAALEVRLPGGHAASSACSAWASTAR